MADPLSVAASAAGLISLGIESCKLIVSYCNDIRGFDGQIDAVALKAGGLLFTLQSLDTLLDETDGVHPKVAADMREKVIQNRQWIMKINDRVSHFSGVAQCLQMNLHTALLALQIQQVSAISRQEKVAERMETLVHMRMDQLGSEMERMTLAIWNDAQHQQVLHSAPDTNLRAAAKATCNCTRVVTSPLNEMASPRTCPRHRRRMQMKARARRFRFASAWLGLSVEATLSILTGGNVLSVCPSLSFHAIVSEDSPAFQLVRSLPPGNSTPRQISWHYSAMTRKLQRMFDSPYASPFDRLQNGRTLLHDACELYRRSIISSREDHPAHAGGLELVNNGNTALDLVMHKSTLDMQTCLLDLGAVVEEDQLIRNFVLGVHVISYLWSYQQEAFFISNAAEAILSHSKHSLKGILKLKAYGPQMMLKLYHMCFQWPGGFSTLHETGRNISSPEMKWLLGAAVLSENIDVAKALVQIGAPVTSAHISFARSEEMEWGPRFRLPSTCFLFLWRHLSFTERYHATFQTVKKRTSLTAFA
ncbi:hypothetical protein BDV10DRAFT_180710 [Aspergillus recurvatus]